MSYPILYSASEGIFTSLGLGTLTDALSCEVLEKRNGAYELTMTYPITGLHFSEIEERRLILAKPNYTDNPQPFRIYRITKPLNGVVTIYAQHISYDLSGYAVPSGIEAGTLSLACSALTQYANEFTITNRNEGSATFKTDVPSSVRSWLGGKEGSLIDLYGGEWHWDMFTCTLATARGANRGVTIRYGKNLTEFEQVTDSSGLYTNVVAFYAGADGEQIDTYNTPIATGLILDTTRTLILDASSEFEEMPTEQQLLAYVARYISSNNLTVPFSNFTLDFVQLEGLSERVDLCDTVNIQNEQLGIISATAKCIETHWDVLKDRYTKSVFGMAKSTLADGIATISQEEANKSAAYMSRNILNTVSELAEDLEAQIDAKIETWCQSSDPASTWTTTQLRNEHNGDFWFYTGITDLTVNGVTIQPSKTYQYNASTNKWALYKSSATSLFDFADGKSTIYYGTPSGTYSNVETGDYLVDSSDGSTYRWTGSAWTKVTDYTTAVTTAINNLKGDLESQIDAKIETWVQNTAPSTAWSTTELQTEHNGDLWYYTGLRYITVNGVTIQPTKTYQYNGSTNKWAAYNNPTTSIFDFADGKTTVYYGSPTGTYTNVEVGDYLVDSSDGSTYRRVGISWTKVTDYASAIASAKTALETAIDNATETITGNKGGYVVIHDADGDGKPDEILIMDTADISTATKVWRWNKNGLGYSSTGYSGTYGTAITAQGQIVADFITTGNLNASLITTGVLNASLITTGSLSADRISGGEITSSAINVVSDSASKSWVTVSFTLGANTYSVKVTPTGFRVELNGVLRAYLSNDSLSLYDSNGNPTFDVASDTGDVILGGDLTATNVYAENENGTNTQLQPIMKWTASAVSFNGYGCYNTGIAANTYTVLSARTPVGSSFAGAVLTPFVAYGTWWLRATDWNSGAIITGGSWTVTAYYIKQV